MTDQRKSTIRPAGGELVIDGNLRITGVFVGPTDTRGFTGSQGPQGASGMGFQIAKIYPSVAALLADTSPTGIIAGQFAIVETGDPDDVENARLFLWDGSVYSYVTDLSGSQGVQGPTGFTGSQGTTGFVGSSGDVGSVGFTGSQGTTGFVGSTGADAFLPANVAYLDQAQTFTDTQTVQTVRETVFTVTGTSPVISPTNGNLQTWELTANSTASFDMVSGDFVTLMMRSNTPDVRSVNFGGNVIWIADSAVSAVSNVEVASVFWQVSSTLYGMSAGGDQE